MKVKTDEWLFIRLPGVTHCDDLLSFMEQASINELGGVRTRRPRLQHRALPLSPVPATPPVLAAPLMPILNLVPPTITVDSPSRKRKIGAVEDDTQHLLPSKRTNALQTTLHPDPPSYFPSPPDFISSCLSSPGPTLSPLFTDNHLLSHCPTAPSSPMRNPSTAPMIFEPQSVPTSATPQSTVLSSTTEPPSASADQLWENGYVYVPDTARWPNGMYSRDMAKGFVLLEDLRRRQTSMDTASRFEQVFYGAHWVSSTYYKQESAWTSSSQAEREDAASRPRNAHGLWKAWRSTASGWNLRRS